VVNETGRLLERVAERAVEDGMSRPEAVRARGTRRTRRQVGVVLASCLAVAVGVAVQAARPPHHDPPPAQEDEQTLRGWSMVSAVQVPGIGAVTSGAGSLWVVDEAGMAITDGRPDGATYEVSPAQPEVTSVAERVAGVSPLVAHGALWELTQGHLDQVTRLDLTTHEADLRPASATAATPVGLAATDDAVFVANAQTGTVSRLDAATGALLSERTVAGRNQLDAMTAGRSHLYVVAGDDLLVLDLDATVVGRVSLGQPGRALVLRGQKVYVATRADRIAVVDVSEPTNPRVVEEAQVYTGFDADIAAIEVTHGFLWVAMWDTENLVQIDLATLQTVGTYHLPLERYVTTWPASIEAADGALWVRVQDELLEFRPR
jgi:hypothetical protein